MNKEFKIKIEPEYIETGFGFPVHLKDVTLVFKMGSWFAKINYNKLSEMILNKLTIKPSRLTGNEVRFIRLHFEMKLEIFAKRFNVTHLEVLKWESKKDNETEMNWSTEKDIRLFIYSNVSDNNEFKNLYNQLEKVADANQEEMTIDDLLI